MARSSFVKFHWRPKLGIQSTIWDEALKLQAADNDYHRRDLFEAIDTGAFPQWDLAIQVFDQEFADAQPYDVLDATKLIPEEDVPLRVIGTMTLNRNVDNFFAETEQVAFLPTNVPPGIDFSNDPLLQGRLFSYLDTQKSRLGTTNFHQIPVNAPRCPFGNFQRDGMMQTMVPKGRANYEPNSLADHGEDGGPRETDAGFATATAASGPDETGDKLRVRAESFRRSLQPGAAVLSLANENEQAHIASSFVFELSKVGLLDQVPPRMVGNLRNVDEDLAKRVADGLGIPLPKKNKAAKEPVDMKSSRRAVDPQEDESDAEGRAVGILIADGTDAAELQSLVDAVTKAKGKAVIVAPKVGGAKLSDGTMQKADGQLAGTPSQLFDAVAILLSKDGCADADEGRRGGPICDGRVRASEGDWRIGCGQAAARQGGRGARRRRDRTGQGLRGCGQPPLLRPRTGSAHAGLIRGRGWPGLPPSLSRTRLKILTAPPDVLQRNPNLFVVVSTALARSSIIVSSQSRHERRHFPRLTARGENTLSVV